jgi:hypothetical protein
MQPSTIASRMQSGYYKLASFCQISMTWKDGKKAFPSEVDAIKSARKPGRYRVSIVDENGRHDLAPFEV